MSKDNYWIINEYAGSPYHGMEFRHYYLGRELIKRGKDITIISASFSHLFHAKPQGRQEVLDGVRYRWVKVPQYKDSHDKMRILKWFMFSVKLFFLLLSGLPRPDVIVVSPMAPFPILPGYFLAKLFRCKLVYEVKDIWPLTLIELGGYSPSHPFIRLMSWFELFALHKSDLIVSNLQNYGAHIRNLGINRDFSWISNGIDLDEVKPAEPLAPEVVAKVPKGKFIVGYAGTVGLANALEYFLAAKKYIENSDIVFVVVGNGKIKAALEAQFNSEDIIFLPAIPKTQIKSLLSLFDACYIGLKKEQLFQYGVSPNKLFDYMYSGKPIIHAISTKNDIVSLSGCGIAIEAEDSQAIANAVEEIYRMSSEDRDKMGQRGRDYVIKNFTYSALAEKLSSIIESLLNGKISRT